MIFWSGKGFFTIVFLLVGIAISQGIYEAVSGLTTQQQDADVMASGAFFIAAISNFIFARYLEKKPKRVMIDKETREEFELDEGGTLFFIKVRKWTIIFAILCVIFLTRALLGWD